MKNIIAPDSFKGSLFAIEFANNHFSLLQYYLGYCINRRSAFMKESRQQFFLLQP
jgi:hypothetical protein